MNGTAKLYQSSLSYEGSTVTSFCDLAKVVLKLKVCVGFEAVHTIHFKFLFEENTGQISDF